MVALNSAEESHSLLEGYRQRLQAYSRILQDESLGEQEKSELLQGLFADFPALVGIVLHEGEEEIGAAFDTTALQAAGVGKQAAREMLGDSSHLAGRLQDREVWVGNATISPDLPSLAMTFELEGDEGRSNSVSAMLRLDDLLRLVSRSRGIEVSLVDSDGVYLAHRNLNAVTGHEKARSMDENASTGTQHSVGVTREFLRDGIDVIGGFADVGIAGMIATSQVPSSTANLASRQLLNRLRAVAPVLLVLATLGGLFWARRITRPMEQLSSATNEIAKGRFDVQVKVDSRDEIGGRCCVGGQEGAFGLHLAEKRVALVGMDVCEGQQSAHPKVGA